MKFDLGTFILDNLEAAGAIGGYVSLSIVGFAIISFATRKRQDVKRQIGPKWAHPIIGSLLGAIPGCGATIVVASLYKNKKITFGGLFATFVSTLGEGSFVLLGASAEANVSGNIKAYATITVFGVIAGIIFGYLSDLINFKTKIKKTQDTEIKTQNLPKEQPHNAYNLIKNIEFYSILIIAIFLAPGSIMALWGGSIEAIADLTYWMSIFLSLICIIFYGINKFIYKTFGHCCIDDNDLKFTISHAIEDVAMVVTYVFIGLFVANYIIDILVGPEAFDFWMTSSPFVVVLIAALIGVTPGCGGMIAVAVAFITIPNFPMAALIAASIATSGDGIFPLLAENKKDGIIVSSLSLVVALVVGYIALGLGF